MNTYLEMAGIHGTTSKIRRLLDTDSAACSPLRIHVKLNTHIVKIYMCL